MDVQAFSTPDIRFSEQGQIGIITLTRPQALNALSLSMIQALQGALLFFEKQSNIKAVLIEGEGRAFCAGGDIVALYHWMKNNDLPQIAQYFDQEYNLNLYIKNYPKPYISYLNGFVMGGGAGISVHGRYRIATEKTIFAMPEAAIGFFTDVGAKYFLKHLPLALAKYICLTGAQLKWGDSLSLGLATHAFLEEDYLAFKNSLAQTGDVEAAFQQYQLPVNNIFPETETSRFQELEALFAADTLQGCFKKLLAANEEALYQSLLKASPLSLKIIFHHLQVSDHADNLKHEIEIEKYLAVKMVEDADFVEGVRALLIEKDKQPRWKFNHIDDITEAQLKRFFP